MLSAFVFAIRSILPILLYMALGAFLRFLRFADDAFWKRLNRLMFHVFLPVLIFCNIYDINSLSDVPWDSFLYVAVIIVLLISLGGIVSLFIKRRECKGVIWQSAFRSNYAILGIPLAESIGGAAALSFASVVAAISVPAYNLAGAVVLTVYAENGKGKERIRKVLLAILKNPLIIAVLLGLLSLLIRALLPKGADGESVFSLSRDLSPVYSFLLGLGRVASPLALVTLGARFDLGKLGGNLRLLTLGTLLRIVIAPAIGIGGALLLTRLGILNVTAEQYPALIAVSGTPAAVSSAVMVSEIGGDEQLANQIVVMSSIFSVFTIMLSLTLLRFLGAI